MYFGLCHSTGLMMEVNIKVPKILKLGLTLGPFYGKGPKIIIHAKFGDDRIRFCMEKYTEFHKIKSPNLLRE